MMLMKKKTHWAWKIYFFIFSIGILMNFLVVLSGESLASQYYQVLMAFKPSYILYYYSYIMNAAITFLSLIPFFLFVFHIRLFKPIIWKILFVAQIFFFFIGHPYEGQMIRAFIHADIRTMILASLLFFLFVLPSYIACFKYAFEQEKLFDK